MTAGLEPGTTAYQETAQMLRQLCNATNEAIVKGTEEEDDDVFVALWPPDALMAEMNERKTHWFWQMAVLQRIQPVLNLICFPFWPTMLYIVRLCARVQGVAKCY